MSVSKQYTDNKLKDLKPFLKWPGGKGSELPVITCNLPSSFKNFYEPFVGGGAVYWSVEANEFFINDKSENLVNLYNTSTNPSQSFLSFLSAFDGIWTFIAEYCQKNAFDILKAYHSDEKVYFNDVSKRVVSTFKWDTIWFKDKSEKSIEAKLKRMKKLEIKNGKLSNSDIISNIEGALKASVYFYLRHIFNSKDSKTADEKAFLFFAMREYSYASMFRHNSKGEFNVPYGGVSYNNKLFKKKSEQIQSALVQEKLAKTCVSCRDFEVFLHTHTPSSDDFIFLDPPYDTEFSTYDKNVFDLKEQERLARYLKNDCKAKFMLVIKNTDLIYSLYKDLNIKMFDKQYAWNIKDRNDRDAEHLIITNYKTSVYPLEYNI